MSDVEWSDEALRIAADLAGRPQRPPRGVLTRQEHTGVYVVFGPDGELEGLKQRLTAAGVELLGSPRHSDPSGAGPIFAMFVRGDCGVDATKLLAIVNGADAGPASGCRV